MENKAVDMADIRESLLTAALPHVTFDGWSDVTLNAAAYDLGIAPSLARVAFPRGALDLAIAYHKRGDQMMQERLAQTDLNSLRFRERVALAVKLRLGAGERDLVRRGAALFALPQNIPTGTTLIWGTADAIWRALGDNSQDINWYSKRATLSAVYSATVLYWLGDESPKHDATWAFLDRRIENVMRFEKAKADFRDSAIGKALKGPLKILDKIKAPAPVPADLPGQEN